MTEVWFQPTKPQVCSVKGSIVLKVFPLLHSEVTFARGHLMHTHAVNCDSWLPNNLIDTDIPEIVLLFDDVISVGTNPLYSFL